MHTKITRVVETSSVGDNGRAVPVIHVEFTVGSNGPFSVELPKAQFTAAAANAKIQEFASHLSGLQGIA